MNNFWMLDTGYKILDTACPNVPFGTGGDYRYLLPDDFMAYRGIEPEISVLAMFILIHHKPLLLTNKEGSELHDLWKENERKGIDDEKVYPHRIDKNCLPHCDVFLENAYTKEEMKIVNETQKILNDLSIGISSTAVRVPVTGGHSESVYLEFEKDFQLNDIRNILSERDEIVLQDDPANNLYPMPINAEGSDKVFVGRIRRDISNPKGLNLWVVADNLRKGAATNAVQIAEIITEKFFLKQRFS